MSTLRMTWKNMLVIFIMMIQQTPSEVTDEDFWFESYSNKHEELCKSVRIAGGHENKTLPGNFSSGRTSGECCGKCSDEPDCFEFGNCCLKMYDSFQHGIDIVSKSRYECVKPQYLDDTISKFFTNWKYWFVTKCPANDGTSDDLFIELCEHPGLNGDLETLRPVSDLSGTTHFMNKYCAFCNNRYDIDTRSKWKLEIHCDEIISLSDENLLVRMMSKKCNILYKRPTSVILKPCKNFPKYTISRCNETGNWDSYDEYVELACNAFVDPFNQTYKNYFCMLCNTRAKLLTPEKFICLIKLENLASVSPPFFAILDIDLWKEQTGEAPKLRCDSRSQFKDTKLMKCLDILCEPPRFLEGELCKTPENTSLSWMCYEFFMKVKPTGNATFERGQVTAYMLRDLLQQVRHIQLLFQEPSPVSIEFDYFLVHVILQGDAWFVKGIERLHNRKVQLDIGFEVLHDRKLGGSQTEFVFEVGLFDVSEYSLYDEVFVTNEADTSKVDTFRTAKLEATPYSTFICPPIYSYTFHKLLYCPYVRIGFDELTVSLENDFLIFWRRSFILKTLLKWEYRLTEGGFLICLDDYIQINNALPDAISMKRTFKLPVQVGQKRILSFSCVCLSLGCLLVTISVYVRLSELRSQPGVNNLILCICLLCAQAVYQFVAGQPEHSRISCAVVGAICHFLWLTVMLALNSCSIQMFMTFRSHARLLSSYNSRTTVITVTYIVGSSLLLVLINILVSLTRTSGSDIGYGGNVCFINVYDMHLITFIIPSFFLILVNLFLFVFVLYKMRKFNIRSVRLNQERSYLRINARLSTLTGLTWLFGFLQILARSDVLEYLFIILNASQGVFIMVAFTCNHRVYSLLFRMPSTRTSLDVAVITKQSSIPN